MFSNKRRIAPIVVAVGAMLLVVTTVAVAASSQQVRQHSQPSQPNIVQASAPTQVRVATNPLDFTTTATSLTLIPGMKITFTVAHSAKVIMHFTDEAGCLSSTAGHWCDVEILMDGVEAAPGAGTDYAIDTSDGSGAYRWIGGALNRLATVAAGTHTVTVVGEPVFSGDTLWTGENDLEVWVF
jgi:hypothetical protein